mmetsp:Transcript_548/g.883  ORF Transcript_548/g.883 Transcript_548/m.883 type:complete len:88 (-) Transcript_548:106-369(-)
MGTTKMTTMKRTRTDVAVFVWSHFAEDKTCALFHASTSFTKLALSSGCKGPTRVQCARRTRRSIQALQLGSGHSLVYFHGFLWGEKS